MESPVRIQVDLSESFNNWLNSPIDALRAIGERGMEEWDYRRDQRRMRNIENAANAALPDIGENPTVPDDDFLNEWFDLASKRSYADWQKALGKMLASEINEPGSVPLRYFVDMARLDKQVLDEFRAYCAWYVPGPNEVILNSLVIPRYVAGANLLEHSTFGNLRPLPVVPMGPYVRVTLPNGEIIRLRNENADIPMGNNRLTEFGKFIYGLLDPKPPPSPELAQSLRELWKAHLYEGDVAAQ